MTPIYDEIKSMLEAGFPLIYLATTEYGRVMQKVRSMSFQLGYKCHTWDAVDGLKTHVADNSCRLKEIKDHPATGETLDPLALLEYLRGGLCMQEDRTPEVFILEDFHKYFDEMKFPEMLRKLSSDLKACNKHIVFISPYTKFPIELEKYITLLTIPLPDKDDLELRLRQVAGRDSNINPDLQKYIIDSALGLTDTEAELAFRLAKTKVGLNRRDAIEVIASEKEQIIKKSGILDYVKVDSSLENSVGGLENLKMWLMQRNKAFELKAKAFGLKEPKGILLLGVPGCGKSLTAQCSAAEWKQPLLKLDIGKVFGQYIGNSESNIRQAIATAEAVAPCVLWIDEIEKGLKVGGDGDGGTTSRVFSTILTWMQEKSAACFVFATSNDISCLPPELFRSERFDRKFFTFMPTAIECAKIFAANIKAQNKAYYAEMENMPVRFRHKQAKQLFATALEEESFWLKIINECCTSDIDACVLKNINEGIKDENGNDKSPIYMWSSSSKPKHKLMTGADISALIKEAKFRIYPEPKDNNSTIIYNETNMGNAVRNILKEGNYKPYGETNLKDIVKCFLKLHENEFVPAGGCCILDFDCYDTDKRLYIHDPNSAKRWENDYDKVLYYTIVGAINHYSKELRTV